MPTLQEAAAAIHAINEQMAAILTLMRAGQISSESKRAWDEWIVGSLAEIEQLASELARYGLDYAGPDSAHFRRELAHSITSLEESAKTLAEARAAIALMPVVPES